MGTQRIEHFKTSETDHNTCITGKMDLKEMSRSTQSEDLQFWWFWCQLMNIQRFYCIDTNSVYCTNTNRKITAIQSREALWNRKTKKDKRQWPINVWRHMTSGIMISSRITLNCFVVWKWPDITSHDEASNCHRDSTIQCHWYSFTFRCRQIFNL